MAIYNPYDRTTEIVTFPNITHNPNFHVGGVAANPHTNLISVVADAGAAFVTAGQDISGTNMLILWDPEAKQEIYRLNLTETTQGRYGGFQDIEFDSRGNVYVVGTFPSSILRVGDNGSTVTEWYKSNGDNLITGFQGLAMTGDILLANDNAISTNGSLVKFDTRYPEGKPVSVTISPPTSIAGSDALYFPPKYNGTCSTMALTCTLNTWGPSTLVTHVAHVHARQTLVRSAFSNPCIGTVLLVAVAASGVEVVRSRDGLWNEAEALGQVLNNDCAAKGANVTAVVQVGSRIYMNEEFFMDELPGNRTKFPWVDITYDVDALLSV